MPVNLDDNTRNIIVTGSSIAVFFVGLHNLYAQHVMIPKLLLRGQKQRSLKNPQQHQQQQQIPPKGSSSSRNGMSTLFWGCIATLLLMLLASALLTAPIVLFGKGKEDGPSSSSSLESSINFCEDDFENSPWIAEPANTMSSLAAYCPLALLGLFGKPSYQWSTRRGTTSTRTQGAVKPRHESRFAVVYSTLLAIGIGSTLLHACLTANAQGGDELPMLWFMASLSFCTLDVILCGFGIGIIKGKTTSQCTGRTLFIDWNTLNLQWVMGASAVLATAVYVCSRENFLPFYLMFTIYTWISLVGSFVIDFFLPWNTEEELDSLVNVLIPLSLATGWIGTLAVIVWVSEMLFCETAKEQSGPVGYFLWNRGIHTMWHCSSAILAWLAIQTVLCAQGLQQGWGTPQLKWWGAPYVVFETSATTNPSNDNTNVKQQKSI